VLTDFKGTSSPVFVTKRSKKKTESPLLLPLFITTVIGTHGNYDKGPVLGRLLVLIKE